MTGVSRKIVEEKMHIRTITEQEALSLSLAEESHFFDRKALAVDGKNIQKVAVAFANADGGEFIVGITDDKHEADPSLRWKGVAKLEELNAYLQALFEVNPSLDLRYEILKCDNKQGLMILPSSCGHPVH